jgi:hypothetical protein
MMARADEPARHRRAHDSGSDPCDFHMTPLEKSAEGAAVPQSVTRFEAAPADK